MTLIRLYKLSLRLVEIDVIRIRRRTPGNFALFMVDDAREKKCLENGLKKSNFGLY